MTMTVGTGPFGHRPAGRFNFALPSNRIEYLEPFPRRIRALIGDEVVIDTIDAQMLHQQRRLPVWCFAPDDVRLEALPDDAVTTHEEGLAKGLIEVRWDAVDEWARGGRGGDRPPARPLSPDRGALDLAAGQGRTRRRAAGRVHQRARALRDLAAGAL